MPEVTRSLRYRINISQGMKGGKSFEATVDAEGYCMAEVLNFSDVLVKALEETYPPEIPEAKVK